MSVVLFRLPGWRVAAPAVARYSSHGGGGDDEVRSLKDASLTALKRGTGGRSSFNGRVCTVFGASGFLGRYLINRLGKCGTQIIIPYRGEFYDVRHLKLAGDLGQVLFTPFDLRDPDSIYKAMKYSNCVINIIGKDHETPNWDFTDVHICGPQRIAKIAKELKIEKFIHFSALNAREVPTPIVKEKGSQFFASKWRGENAVREAFPEAVIFRPSDIFGQEDRFLRYYVDYRRRQIRHVPLWNKGEGVVKQPVWVVDVAKGVLNALSDPDTDGKVYQAVGPRRYELSELVDWIHKVQRRSKWWGYRRTNMKYNPLYWMQVKLIETLHRYRPPISWERIEREHTSDITDPRLPTLEDLGVTLTNIEDRIDWEIRPWKRLNYYNEKFGETVTLNAFLEEFGEFSPPAPPKQWVDKDDRL